MRFVIDTNVWISYFLWKTPLLERLINSTLEYGEIFASEETLEEFFQTIDKEKFKKYLNLNQKEEICSDINQVSNIISIKTKISDCRDQRDNIFLELAYSCFADIIITGDKDLLEFDPWRDIRILTPRQYIEIYMP